MVETLRRNWLVIGALVAILLLVGFNSISQVQATQEKQEAQQTTVYVVTRVGDVCADEEKIAQDPELQALCTEVDEISQDLPEVEAGPPGEKGEKGDKGDPPTEEQIRVAVQEVLNENPEIAEDQIEQAVVNYLIANPPEPGKDGEQGEPGEDGSDGLNASDEQVAAAVAQYCADGACVGAPGQDGQDGEPGEDGTDGQNATDAQIQEAIENYCANDACKGPKGDPGDNTTECPEGYEWHEEYIENSSIETGTYYWCKLVE